MGLPNTTLDPHESICSRLGDDVAGTLAAVANRYVGENPALPFTFRAFSAAGILQLGDGRYDLNLGRTHPDAVMGGYAYACGRVYLDAGRTLELSLSCYGPTRIFLGGSLLYKSDVSEDVNLENRKVIPARLGAGWNDFVLTLRKTASGFGCRFGSNLPKWAPLGVLSPFAERAGAAGWAFSEVVGEDRYRDERPDLTASEAETGLRWFPELDWPEGDRRKLSCARLFGPQPGRYAYAWTSLVSPVPGRQRCVLEGLAAGATRAWLDGEEILATDAGPFRAEVGLEYGPHTLLVETVSGEDDWGVALGGTVAGAPCALETPVPVHGLDDPWLYLGPFSAPQDPARLTTLYRLFGDSNDNDNEGEGRYWRVDRPETWVRPFLENPLFAKWSYPLGVTLYGLLQTGRVLNRGDLVSYVTAHISECTRLHPYALWDGAHYGFPGINQQLAMLDMLDDCGSFGSAMLEAHPEADDPGYLAVAEIIAEHMAERQERLPDGAFYRRLEGDFMENTLWADDLYMSTPFMLRYARLSGQRAFLDDAARQFLLFKKYLFIPEHRVLSHVYDFKYGTATLVPWGRGNGWALFLLSELLGVLPSDHPDRGALLAFFRELSGGYRALQGAHGLWHQVLTDPESYEETSCTAMFAYGFARGVRFGWFEDPGPYANAVHRAWRGLTARAVDRQGNVHGVCRGSRYSFTPDYYRDELGTVLNDTHGIGIVLLAGIEVQKLRAFLRGAQAADPSVIPPVIPPVVQP